jgi:translation initiation factor IF-1
MGWVNEAIVELRAGRTVQVQASGGSMRGRIESGQLVTLAPIDVNLLRVGDAVLVRWQGNYLLHLIHEIHGDRLLIANNLGKINGSVARSDVIGIVTKTVDEPVTTAAIVAPVKSRTQFAYVVRLDDGTEVVAIVPKRVALQKVRMSPGRPVIVSGLWNEKYQIQGFAD